MISIEHDFDLVLANGSVADGLGGEPRRADVGIRGTTIYAVGDLANATARQAIDCSSLCVSPGFIDVHSHSDTYILLRPDAPSKIRQGVTTEIVGQCGSSASPLKGGARLPSDWASHKNPHSWHNAHEYAALLREASPLMNIVFLTGHRNLRMAVMGMEARPATKNETVAMTRLLSEELEGGSSGFSTGLLYQPSCHALAEEIKAIASECARQGGHYATHLRSEGERLIESIDEAIETARASGVPLQISHFKTSGKDNWHKLETAISHIEAARAEGLRVAADRYPYTAAGTDLDVILPEWAERGDRTEILTRLRNPATRAKIVDEMMTTRSLEYWSTVMVGATWADSNTSFRGRRIDEISAELGVPPAEAVLRIVEADELRTGGFFFGMSEDNLRRILSLPWVMIGSDASLRSVDGLLSDDYPHPRAFGTFPRFLALCRDEKLMTLGEAVRRVTSLPAETFRLKGRGVIRKGNVADICIFDPDTVRDSATYANPHAYPTGIAHVICSGKLAL